MANIWRLASSLGQGHSERISAASFPELLNYRIGAQGWVRQRMLTVRNDRALESGQSGCTAISQVCDCCEFHQYTVETA
jgi:hypothetical protein